MQNFFYLQKWTAMKKESELKRSGLLFVWKTFSILFYCLVQRIVPLCTRYIHSLLAYNGLKLCGLNLVHTSLGLNILAIAIQCFIIRMIDLILIMICHFGIAINVDYDSVNDPTPFKEFFNQNREWWKFMYTWFC